MVREMTADFTFLENGHHTKKKNNKNSIEMSSDRGSVADPKTVGGCWLLL